MNFSYKHKNLIEGIENLDLLILSINWRNFLKSQILILCKWFSFADMKFET